MTAKELKNRTGEALRAVAEGRQVLLTRRGRPIAIMTPAEPSCCGEDDDLPYDEAWQDIEAALRRTKPRESTWKRAMDLSRRRS